MFMVSTRRFVTHKRSILCNTFKGFVSHIIPRVVWSLEQHCLPACIAAERGEDMLLGMWERIAPWSQ